MEVSMSLPARAALVASCMLLVAASAVAGAPTVREFTVQPSNGGGWWCYHVSFDKPDGLLLPAWGKRDPYTMARLPRLFHENPHATGLSLLPVTHLNFTPGPLQFVGRWPNDTKEMSFRLLYPVAGKGGAADSTDNLEWVEAPVTLKWSDSRPVIVEGPNRKQPLRVNDVEGMWAAAQQAEFARLAAQAPDFPCYQFGQVSLSRRYDLPMPAALASAADRQPTYREIFEVFTGSASITESLQTRRLIKPPTEKQQRWVDVSGIRGIELAE